MVLLLVAIVADVPHNLLYIIESYFIFQAHSLHNAQWYGCSLFLHLFFSFWFSVATKRFAINFSFQYCPFFRFSRLFFAFIRIIQFYVCTVVIEFSILLHDVYYIHFLLSSFFFKEVYIRTENNNSSDTGDIIDWINYIGPKLVYLSLLLIMAKNWIEQLHNFNWIWHIGMYDMWWCW